MGVDVPSPTWRALNERNLADAREQLDAETFDAAWMEGRAMTLDEALAGEPSPHDLPSTQGPCSTETSPRGGMLQFWRRG